MHGLSIDALGAGDRGAGEHDPLVLHALGKAALHEVGVLLLEVRLRDGALLGDRTEEAELGAPVGEDVLAAVGELPHLLLELLDAESATLEGVGLEEADEGVLVLDVLLVGPVLGVLDLLGLLEGLEKSLLNLFFACFHYCCCVCVYMSVCVCVCVFVHFLFFSFFVLLYSKMEMKVKGGGEREVKVLL